LSKIGMWNKEARNYTGARAIKFVIHPSSGLAKKPPAWVMAAELVETSQLFARTVAKLDPAWLEQAAGPLCKHNYGDPHWDAKQAQVVARDHVTLYGLPVASRSVAYARFDPVLCRELFITHALVRHEYTTKAPFMEHNRRVQDEAQRLRDKARRSDMFADDSDQFAFFDQRIPASVVSGATFEAWRAKAEPKLELSLADVLLSDAHDLAPARFPDRLTVRGVELALAYRFDPGEDDDGITITLPVAMLPQLDADAMTWTIAGWQQPKILALLESLPKAQRKPLAPLDLLAHELAAALPAFEGALLPVLERAIFERTGERIARSAWDLRTVPQYLSFNYRVVDDKDKVLATGRDLEELQRALGQRAREVWAAAPRERYERTALRGWDFAALAESVTIDVGGRRMLAYPALVDRESSVDLRLLESPAAAAAATREGMRRLVLFASGQSFAKLEAVLPAALAKDVRRQLVLRALDDAFELAEPPRDKAAFERRVTAGRGQVSALVAELGRTAQLFTTELDKVRAALKPLAGKPGLARTVFEDVTSQLAHLAPADLWSAPSAIRIEHRLRYVKALQVRMQRQAHDPPKDQTKAAQVVPLWTAFVARRAELLAKGRTARELDDFGWLLEELRVAVFAPELKTAVPVSVPRVQEQWQALAR
ncbi:MAG TPA: DUF3418 domain-containing protein, partial [Kofleriaceae bacterium]|nr:DUF3418 domain-containing protein [Kofleriaceae bacterium]